MAAGMGSRYGGIKQIDPVGQHGELIIDYSIYDAIEAGFDRVVFIIRKAIEKDFCEAIFDRIKAQNKIKAEYVFQELDDLPQGFTVPEGRTKPWGTAHAILAARHVIGEHEPFIAVNADEFYGRAAYEKMANFFKSLNEKSKGKYAFVTVKLENMVSEHGTVSRGVCETDAGGNITEINERLKVFRRDNQIGYTLSGEDFHPLDKNANVNVNFFGFTGDMMTTLQQRLSSFLTEKGNELKSEFLIPVVVSDLIKEGKITLKNLGTCEDWLSSTYKEDKAFIQSEIAKKIESGTYPSPLWVIKN